MSDQEFLTKEDVKSLLAEVLGEHEAKLDRRLEVLATNLKESSTSWLDDLIDEAENLPEDEFDYTGDDDDDEDGYEDDEDDYEEEAEVTRPDPQLLRLKREMEQLKREREEEREAREQAERNQKVSAMRSQALDEIRKSGKVSNPEAFLKLLEADGHLVEDGDKFAIKARDEFGELKKSVADSIEGLVEKDYNFMAPSRPGTGTGATQGSSVSRGGGFKYLRDGKPSKEEVLEIMKDPKARAEYLAEVAAAQQ